MTTSSTIDPAEADHFGAMAEDWWDPAGRSAMLHKLNPVRLSYVRDRINHHWALDECDIRPLVGRRAADIGCGGGLLAEPLARLGAEVVAVDAAPATIEVARDHAAGQGLEIDYRVGGVEQLNDRFDLVTSMEVIEHVADVRGFVQGLADSLAADGLLILSTPNRTAWSRLIMIVVGEGTGQIPKGTHDWDKFLCPEELCALLADCGLETLDVTGLGWSPMNGFSLSDDKSLNYLVTARRRAVA